MKLVLATTNPHKLTEIQAILTGLPIQIDILDRRLGISTPEETGQTFADNARLKVLHYARHFSDLTVAEDSGLEIGALNGAPGLLSSRFNGESYAEKFATIYAKLRARGSPTSAARFVCALAVADGARVIFETSGMIEGYISRAPRGTGGFGYDPIFFYPPYDRTLAEVSAEAKAAVSHRGKAFRALRTFLNEHLRKTPEAT